MAEVVLLRGVNVGGHRTFRPSVLARQLRHLAAVNIGAAGTFVIRRPAGRAQLRAEFARRLPFGAVVVICRGPDFQRILSHTSFADVPQRPDIVRFVSVLTGRPRPQLELPLTLPARGRWLMKILARDGRFVFGQYRRDMKVIGYLGRLDGLFGVPATTRNWNTVVAIARVLNDSDAGR
jgi:uncharacterized protein (DUF1697 family)